MHSMLKKLVFCIFMALSVSTMALNVSSDQRPPKEITTKDLDGTVEVSFRIDGSGKVEIISINATSPQLADYVIKKLSKIQLQKGDPQIGQVIKYRFVFKKQA
ncbi:MAG: hypothetical protein RLZZ77_2406 [Bacteroidota bacterium]